MEEGVRGKVKFDGSMKERVRALAALLARLPEDKQEMVLVYAQGLCKTAPEKEKV